MKKLSILLFQLILLGGSLHAQDDLLSLVEDKTPKREHVRSAFKSTRVIMGQSMELLSKGVMDVRILHRFGLLNGGYHTLFGLDQASMRLGFDYGITNGLSIGIGRSTYKQELDGFIKFRPIWQSRGPGAIPFSVVVVSGITYNTMDWADPTRKNFYSSRMAFFNQLIFGRKFSEGLTLQLTPTFLHRNMVPTEADPNDIYALGFGGRIKLSRRLAFTWDYFYVANGLKEGVNYSPFSVGFDIETGGHVFQLNFSNSIGMNERAFLTETMYSWKKGQVLFGFNLSRVFTIAKPK